MVFKTLDARQSEIHVQFTRNTSFTLCKNTRNYILWRGFVDNFCGYSSGVDLVCQNLNILSFENIEISLYAQARQSLLLLTQGDTYNRLRSLNKYLMFLEELNRLFGENWSKFVTAGYLVFWKYFPAAGYLDTSYKYGIGSRSGIALKGRIFNCPDCAPPFVTGDLLFNFNFFY